MTLETGGREVSLLLREEEKLSGRVTCSWVEAVLCVHHLVHTPQPEQVKNFSRHGQRTKGSAHCGASVVRRHTQCRMDAKHDFETTDKMGRCQFDPPSHPKNTHKAP